jgi:hypothetical protein
MTAYSPVSGYERFGEDINPCLGHGWGCVIAQVITLRLYTVVGRVQEESVRDM